MLSSILICLASFAVLICLLRSRKLSIGLPIAYLFALLFIHVPGAVAHLLAGQYLFDDGATEIGIRYTAISSICFVVGVWLVQQLPRNDKSKPHLLPPAAWRRFALFCLLGGLLVTYTLRLMVRIPSIGAIIEKGGGIWVLGALLGLGMAMKRSDLRGIALWCLAMGVYPVLTLLLGGFLSFGSTPIFIILSALVISTRSHWKVALAVPLASVLFFLLFLSYFQNRDDIRDSVWGGAELRNRVSESLKIVTDVKLFDPNDPGHLNALDRRLNQNFFVGRAAQRLETGEVDYLHGRSFWEGAISLVPRVLWPSKPVYGGSPEIIMDMTGFVVNDTTSYGVGNVMEFHINFGIPSLIVGFLVIGFAFGWLDLKAAICIREGNPGRAILFFMPAAAMIHPNGSLVEMVGGGGAAFFAALAWRWLWENKGGRREMRAWHRVPRAGDGNAPARRGDVSI